MWYKVSLGLRLQRRWLYFNFWLSFRERVWYKVSLGLRLQRRWLYFNFWLSFRERVWYKVSLGLRLQRRWLYFNFWLSFRERVWYKVSLGLRLQRRWLYFNFWLSFRGECGTRSVLVPCCWEGDHSLWEAMSNKMAELFELEAERWHRMDQGRWFKPDPESC